MNKDEFEKFTNPRTESASLRGASLQNKTPRTLIYGYSCDRETVHVYLDDKHVLNRVIYDIDGFLLSHGDETTLLPSDYVPEKRAYPETCDLAFCQLLQRAGVALSFTGFNDKREPATWYGKRKEGLIVTEPNDHLPPLTFSVDEFNLELVPYLSDYAARRLEGDVSVMVSVMFDRVYRRVKYLKSDELPMCLEALPGNIEWSIQKVYETVQPNETNKFQLESAVSEALRNKVEVAVMRQLSQAGG